MSIGALQETKWFGDEVCDLDGSMLLTAGQPAPAVGAPVHTGEGVALVLDGLEMWWKTIDGVKLKLVWSSGTLW